MTVSPPAMPPASVERDSARKGARSGSQARAADTIAAICLFFSTACAYLASFSGKLRSTDELEMFTMAWSLVVHGSLTIDQLRWALKTPGTGFDLYGADGQLYSYIEPLHSLLALPLVWLGSRLAGVGNVEVALLFNVFVTALIPPAVYYWLRRLAFPGRVAALTALAIGLGTMLWPYAKTFFREPLAALTMTLLFLVWTVARQTDRPLPGLLTGILLGLHGGVRLSNFASGLGLAAGSIVRDRRPPWRAIAFSAIGLAVALLLVVGLELARAGGRFQAVQIQSSLPAAPIYVGLYGLLVSPGKGFFWYSPVALLALFGLRDADRRYPAEMRAIGVTTVVWLIVLALYYDWWGGLGWGPRFMAGLVPLLALPLAVVFERVLRPRADRRLGFTVGAVAAVSVLVQLLAVTGDYGAYLAGLVERFGTTVPETTVLMTSPLLSPVLGQVQEIAQGRLDLALAVPGPDGWRIFPAPLLAGLVAASGFGWLAVRPPGRRWAIAGAIAAGSVLTVWLAVFVVAAGSLGRATDDVARAPAVLAARAAPADTVVTLLGNETHRYLNWDKSAIPNVGLALAPFEPGSRTEQLLQQLLARPQTLWLVMQGVDRADRRNGVERWLAARAFRGEQAWYGGVRVVPYRTQPTGRPAPALPSLPAEIGPVRLLAASVTADVSAGGAATLETRWLARETPDERLRIFANLVRLNGRGEVTSIAEPLDGYLPTTDWQPGREVVDRRLLEVPETAEPGVYRLEVGLFDPAANRRLSVGDGTAVIAAYVAIRPSTPVVVPSSARPVGASFALPTGSHAVALDASEVPATVLPGGRFTATLYWRDLAPIDEDLAVFVHALDAAGAPAFQHDATAGGRYPSGIWRTGEIVADEIPVEVPAMASGRYRLVAGLYRRSSGARLPVQGGGDTVDLGTIEVTP